MRLGKRERAKLRAEKARYQQAGPALHIRSAWDMIEDWRFGHAKAPHWAGKSISRKPSKVRQVQI